MYSHRPDIRAAEIQNLWIRQLSVLFPKEVVNVIYSKGNQGKNKHGKDISGYELSQT